MLSETDGIVLERLISLGYLLRPEFSDSEHLNLADIAKRCQKHDLALAA
jgi:hypothetical protein